MTVDFPVAELMSIVRGFYEANSIGEVYEALFARVSGWKQSEFERLYAAYIESTQVDLTMSGNQTTELKGNPLERVARYFLEQGGIAKRVAPGGVNGRWTVDGIGETYPDRIQWFFNDDVAKNCGAKLYMEAKNKDEVMGPEDWAQHCMRMRNHCCSFGVAFSTSGFAIGGGLGFAEEIYNEFLRGRLHLLLSVEDLKTVVNGEYPWSILKRSFIRTSDEAYRRSEIQKQFAAATCRAIASAEYARLRDA